MRLACTLVVSFLLAASALAAQEAGGASAPDQETARLEPCGAPEYRQFDSWIGEWDVVNAAAEDAKRPPASNSITSVHGGCAIREEYRAPGGYSGTSLSFYDARTGRWHQTWIDNRGGPLYLEGGLRDGSMVLQGTTSRGRTDRITWTPRGADRVRQFWETSPDDGRTWKTVFDGSYSRSGD